jgi:hypothetical protein
MRLMKRRDFIKGLVAVPLIGYVGITTGNDGVKLFRIPRSSIKLETVDDLTRAMESIAETIEPFEFETVTGLAPIKREGQAIKYDNVAIMYALGTTIKENIPRVLQCHLQTFIQQCKGNSHPKLFWRQKPMLNHTSRGYEVSARYAIA